MEELIFRFMKNKLDARRPVLLALSGGPDSLALFHALMKVKDSLGLQLGIAHVDHRWRDNSADEAGQLKAAVEDRGLVFHLKTLNPRELKGNLEAACREERLKFFLMLSRTYGYQAVLLGHHADDQAETVLKKILEGADLHLLSGLPEEASINGLTIWRPFLSLRKQEILDWLQKKSIVPFEDHTNLDPRFLRGRFRTSIIPYLSSEFGKEVGPSLCRLAQEAKELRAFLDQSLQPCLDKIIRGPMGLCLDLSESCPHHSYEVKYLVRKVCREAGFGLPCELLKNASRFVVQEAADKEVLCAAGHVVIDRRRVFCLSEGTQPAHLEGAWKIDVIPCNEEERGAVNTDWRQIWQGEGRAVLPAGDYRLGLPVLSSPYPRSTPLRKWWSNAKVPAFLRSIIPVIWKGDSIAHEFLTGRPKFRLMPGEPAFLIKMRYMGGYFSPSGIRKPQIENG